VLPHNTAIVGYYYNVTSPYVYNAVKIIEIYAYLRHEAYTLPVFTCSRAVNTGTLSFWTPVNTASKHWESWNGHP